MSKSKRGLVGSRQCIPTLVSHLNQFIRQANHEADWAADTESGRVLWAEGIAGVCGGGDGAADAESWLVRRAEGFAGVGGGADWAEDALSLKVLRAGGIAGASG